jgi:hypothetical protein
MATRWSSALVFAAVSVVVADVAPALRDAADAHAWTLAPATVAELTASAARVFRGHCVAATVGKAEVAGTQLTVTTYTFRVSDHLKGGGADIISFRQVGTPAGSPRDLGRLAGLPVYVPGIEYVLFLLPESHLGLTSPAGAGQGIFVVHGAQVRAVASGPGFPGGFAAEGPEGAHAAPLGGGAIPYETLRRLVLEQLGR